MPSLPGPASAADPAPATRLRRLAPLVLIILAAAVICGTGLYRELSFEALVRHRAAIDAAIMLNRPLAIASFMALYIAVVALSIPGATILTIIGGLLFGCLTGGIAAVISATLGATVIFLIARSAVGDWLRRCAGERFNTLAEGFRHDAFSYLLFLRLVPAFPFWLVNLVPALCGVALLPFIAATAIGIIPVAFIGAFFGASLDEVIANQESTYMACIAASKATCRLELDPGSMLTPGILFALAAVGLLALLPVVVRRMRAARS